MSIVGCDMDGTLYDEAEFIAQVYWPIAEMLAITARVEPKALYSWTFQRWFEKGSSYPNIFSEAIAGLGMNDNDASTVIRRSLQVFRGFQPELTLPSRVRATLDALQAEYRLFLITDSSAVLQKNKFDFLVLIQWFAWPNVGISGCYGSDFCKPSTRILRKIELLDGRCSPSQVVFFGDRQVNAQFAINAGFQFAHVACMHPISEG